MSVLAGVLEVIQVLVYVSLAAFVFVSLRRRPTRERFHFLMAFSFVGLAFVSGFIVATALSLMGSLTGTVIAFKVFDASLMVAVFWFYLFLSDFVPRLKGYAPLSLVGMVIVIGMIALFPVEIVGRGYDFVELRHVWTSAAIVLFWVTHFVLGCYVFFRSSRYIEERLPRTRVWLMALGIAFAVLAYPTSIVLPLLSRSLLSTSQLVTYALTIGAGVLFFLGAEMPGRLKRMIAAGGR